MFHLSLSWSVTKGRTICQRKSLYRIHLSVLCVSCREDQDIWSRPPLSLFSYSSSSIVSLLLLPPATLVISVSIRSLSLRSIFSPQWPQALFQARSRLLYITSDLHTQLRCHCSSLHEDSPGTNNLVLYIVLLSFTAKILFFILTGYNTTIDNYIKYCTRVRRRKMFL